MAARKRAPSEESLEPQPKSQEKPTTTNSTTDLPPIAPSKAAQILKISLIFFVPYFYLIFSHYTIDADLKRSIIINAVLSSVGFFVSRYVLRRNLFGYDINKKGTPQGLVKV
ncbi:uncharacterized protein LOC130752240 [Actinidia eriantha]|uniref:uncharacterized protein LOC130752240 n=1 Tax=Actinidia eriantha TaxID=165200 RepID=UPI00258AC45B|nr:uncharacterized protein LOC130752240 [Actinidia eriantha]